ncbi:DNA polymerase-4 [Nakamurella panacisegetis]|uniref:DNA polymerase IV n=1 Tax=Nakamurella panacisegetis TaxID=1090615 RepID=A0A1H0Q815_9ACTN|nr:DNA polymerase IV [Nakamurella panacisegetis]SDP13165.1 DNA polymerase-4 [Nakamurella panacisegetis]
MGQSANGRRYITDDLEAIDDRLCTILHVDMDAFFASVELRRRPELRGRPMMVAGDSGRGVVLSATYEARTSGVRSAMPTGRAKALCPGIIVIEPDQAAYREASQAVMAIFGDVTPLVEPLSVDEAFLDISGARRLAGRPGQIAARLRTRIRDELGLTATVGGAATKFIAKLASGLAKPDGLLLVPPDHVLDLLHPLPVRALWGVGPKTAQTLEALGLSTVGEMAAMDRASLMRHVGRATGAKLHDLANGLDDRSVETVSTEGSIGAETTFSSDTSDRAFLNRELLALAEKTARRAREAGLRGRTVALKVRFEDFSTVSRSVTLSTPTDLSGVIHRTAAELLAKLGYGRLVRLVGIRLEQLVTADQVSEQLELGVDDDRPGWREAEGALDRVTARFGSLAVRRASLFDRPNPPLEGENRSSGHPNITKESDSGADLPGR